MAKVIIDSAALEQIAQEIDHCGFMLGFVSDEDDIDDVVFFARRIRDAASNLRGIVKESQPAKGGNHE